MFPNPDNWITGNWGEDSVPPDECPELNVDWVCPECGAKNQDSYAATAFPFCEMCNWSVSVWNDILSDEEMDQLNEIWESLE